MTRPNLDDLIALTLDAGREIMAVRQQGFDTLKKLDGSVVTIADQRAEEIIEAGLKRLAPSVPMIGEEAVAAGRIPDPGQLFFCVDPLDGTRGFVKGGDDFTVNIALVENGTPVQGVIYAPVSGEVFTGEPGRAFKARHDARTGAMLAPPAPIAVTAAVAPWRVIASLRTGHNDETRAFLGKFGAHTQTALASSIKFCRLAEGVADLYPRFGTMSEWDAAAGHAILTAAGGGVMRADGGPLIYGRHDDAFLIRGLIAYGGDAAKAAALKALRA